MQDNVNLWEIPTAKELYMLIGWNQWADAGSISSGLPLYLMHKTHARKIGEVKDDGYYLFQLPGAHHFLRPEIKLEDGYRQSLKRPQNDIYYTGDDEKGLVIFLGEEPHMRVDHYVTACLDVIKALKIKRVVAVGGVYGEMPYDKDREVSCVYSKQEMQEELNRYAVRFSNYEGGTTIGTYFIDAAERADVEFLVFYAFVPAYNFAEMDDMIQAISIEHDFKAWYDLMRRINHMFDMEIDLEELLTQSLDLTLSMDDKIAEFSRQMPDVDIQAYMEDIEAEFTERPFIPLSDVWGKALGTLFKGSTEDEDPPTEE